MRNRATLEPIAPFNGTSPELQVSVEDNMPASSVEELLKRGHKIVTVDDYNQFGCAQLIWKLEGGYFTASDPRRDGQAVGF